MNKTPHSLYTIRFTDCDPFGHLNNGRYIDYLLNAREDHLKTEYGVDLSQFVEMQMMDENLTQLKAFMWTRFIHVNEKSGRRENHTDSFMDFSWSVEATGVNVTKGYQHRLKEVIEIIKHQKI